jgi:putative DNA primase/helicase
MTALRDQGILSHGNSSSPRLPRKHFEFRPEQPQPVVPDAGAVALWHSAKAIDGTSAETYLKSHRRLAGPPWPPTIRYRGDVRPYSLPAVVAAVQAPDRRVVAVQVTFLRPSDGAKALVRAPKMIFGRLYAGAVRLAPAAETLGLAEGLETGLSAMQMTGVPVWVALGKRLDRLGLPREVRRVVIFGDNDDSGREAAESAADEYSRQGRAVEMRWPPEGHEDFNDALRASRRAA